MNDLINRILDLPRHQRVGILAGLMIVLLVLDYFLFYAPRSYKISEARENIEGARMVRNKKRRLAANLPKLQRELREKSGLLKEAVAQLPDRKEIPDLLRNISSKAREAGLQVLTFRPRGEKLQAFYAEIPVDIVVRGRFHDMVVFFSEVGKLRRLVNIQNIEIQGPQNNDKKLLVQTSAQATTFRFLSEAERQKGTGSGGKGQGRSK
ncbi:MAG: type 4a pilus biogenesis protein PilO [Candidatus Binatia bacterium]